MSEIMFQLDALTLKRGDHVVHFYEQDAELVETVGGYLAKALRNDAIGIVLATASHRSAFAAELQHAGVDVAAASHRGSLVWLDSAAILVECLEAGELQPDAFDRVVAQVVRDAAGTGREICVYGELVAALWEQGNVPAALEVEDLWHRLAGEVPFSLLCAYGASSVSGEEHRLRLEEVCHLHTSVLTRDDPPEAEHPPQVPRACRHFAADTRSPGDAREFLADVLAERHPSTRSIEDALLVVSELATNAVIHAATSFSVVVGIEGSDVRISVRDGSPVAPSPRDPAPADPSGRGLRLVSSVARSWGFEASRGGKSVWAVVPAPDRAGR